jgi:hypothetical protein
MWMITLTCRRNRLPQCRFLQQQQQHQQQQTRWSVQHLGTSTIPSSYVTASATFHHSILLRKQPNSEYHTWRSRIHPRDHPTWQRMVRYTTSTASDDDDATPLLASSFGTEESLDDTNSSSNCSSSSSSSSSRRWITYMTDVEGDRDYLHRYVEQSKILCWKEHTPLLSPSPQRPYKFPYTQYIDFQNYNDTTTTRTTANSSSGTILNDILVYGGDIWDQGGSDLYVIRQLLDIQRRYPNNVYFVMGNRDINKMRIVDELGHAGTSDHDMPIHDGCYWLYGTGRMGDPQLGKLPLVTAAERLKWMLNYTMGSPRAFEYRRWELQTECSNTTMVSDQDVVESYRQSCDPITGEISLFLRNASLMLRLGDVAFVHGALPFTNENLLLRHCDNNHHQNGSLWNDVSFAMPWLPLGVTASDVGVHSIHDWIVALNTFATSRIESWIASNGRSDAMWTVQGGYRLSTEHSPSYGQLLQYGMGRTGGPTRGLNPTVVYNRWGIAGRPRKFFRYDVNCAQDVSYVRHTKEFFRRTGIRLICSGHQPSGEMPCHIRIDDEYNDNPTSWILSGDTSYTGDTIWLNLPGDSVTRHNCGRGDIKSGRGPVAVSEVLIEQCTTSGTILEVYSHGTFSDGSKYRSQSLDFERATFPKGTDDLVVGTLASGKLVPNRTESPHGGPWWTQAALDDGSVLLAAGAGFNFWTRMIDTAGKTKQL